jgi:hypothetical protein
MDRRKGRRFAEYSADEIEANFKANPDDFDETRGYEALVGCILSRVAREVNNEEITVGFMMRGSFGERTDIGKPTLHSLIQDRSLVEDDDADLWMHSNHGQGPIQVTRLTDVRGSAGLPELLELIDKKCLVQKDEFLQLVVLLDSNFDLDLEQLRNELKQRECSYARIYLIGQLGRTPRLGEFSCLQIYPDLTAKTRVSLKLQ